MNFIFDLPENVVFNMDSLFIVNTIVITTLRNSNLYEQMN